MRYTSEWRGLSPLSKDSKVLPKLDVTGLFHLASLVGPIKREQDEIKKEIISARDTQESVHYRRSHGGEETKKKKFWCVFKANMS